MATARVQSISASGLQTIPMQFVRPLHERPGNINGILQGHFDSIPVVDLSALEVAEVREKTLEEIGRASQEWGVFQVINHGISESLFERLQTVGKQFFDLPQEEKETYANNGGDGVLAGYGTRLPHHVDGRQGWSDFFYHILWPASRRDFSKWPQQPSSYIEITDEYTRGVVEVVNKLLSALSLNLGLHENVLKDALGSQNLEMALKINYYPPCPQPELALGVLPHTDFCALTVLKPNDVPGLQVYKDGNWVTAAYVPNALVIHIGDLLQILSNGKYKSILHRSLVNKEKTRMSWPIFCSPPGDAVIGPVKELIDENNPPLFNDRTFSELKRHKFSTPSQYNL
eukprot:Gb_19822 [translate_table: standard]